MLRDMLLSVIFAGLAAGLVFSWVQRIWVTPLILQAEVYEDAANQGTINDAHDHASAWQPADGWQRQAFTIAANVVMGFAYGFVLIAVYLLWRHPQRVLTGMLFGLAGFVVFFAAPGLALPPSLPGTELAELSLRQEWWVAIAACTAIGLALISAQPRWWLRAVGFVLLIAPHLLERPRPEVDAALSPAELQRQFQWATTICNAIFWLVLGAASSIAYRKMLLARVDARG